MTEITDSIRPLYRNRAEVHAELAAMQAELQTVGISSEIRKDVSIYDRPTQLEAAACGFSCDENGRICFLETWVDQSALDALDIIRKHIHPKAGSEV